MKKILFVMAIITGIVFMSCDNGSSVLDDDGWDGNAQVRYTVEGSGIMVQTVRYYVEDESGLFVEEIVHDVPLPWEKVVSYSVEESKSIPLLLSAYSDNNGGDAFTLSTKIEGMKSNEDTYSLVDENSDTGTTLMVISQGSLSYLD